MVSLKPRVKWNSYLDRFLQFQGFKVILLQITGEGVTTIPTEHSNDEPIITLENLSIGYSKPLVESVNLKIYQGDRIAIIGSSGIGKTTLLRTISGFNRTFVRRDKESSYG